MTLKNLTTTLDEGLIRTWRFPRRSALTMLFRQSFYINISISQKRKEKQWEGDVRGRIREPFYFDFEFAEEMGEQSK